MFILIVIAVVEVLVALIGITHNKREMLQREGLLDPGDVLGSKMCIFLGLVMALLFWPICLIVGFSGMGFFKLNSFFPGVFQIFDPTQAWNYFALSGFTAGFHYILILVGWVMLFLGAIFALYGLIWMWATLKSYEKKRVKI